MRGPRDDGDAEPAAASEGETDESASHGDDDAPFELPGRPTPGMPGVGTDDPDVCLQCSWAMDE